MLFLNFTARSNRRVKTDYFKKNINLVGVSKEYIK